MNLFYFKGQKGLGEHIDYIYTNLDYATREIQNRRRSFTLILEKFDTPFISFYYIPRNLRNMNRNSPEFIQQMNSVGNAYKNFNFQIMTNNVNHCLST